jgi:5-formyltetrahydrofolate cyclo-ligase
LRRELEEARLAIHSMEESSQQKETVLKELHEKLKNQDEQQVCLVVHIMKTPVQF